MDTRTGPVFAPLLVRPRPMNGESLRGFLLRAAEANGYVGKAANFDFPSLVLGYKNAPLSKMAVLARISSALLIPESDLEKMVCKYIGAENEDLCCYAGNLMSVLHLRSGCPAICPLCLEEQMATRAIWDLRAITVCTRHGNWIVDVCPGCSSRLRWQRQGTAKCVCGYDLRRIRTIDAPRDAVLLSMVLEELFFMDLTTYPEDGQRFPWELRSAKLSELLGMHRLMQNLLSNISQNFEPTRIYTSSDLERAGRAMSLLADVLTDWPCQLPELLLETGSVARHAAIVMPLCARQIKAIYVALYKASVPSTSDVLAQPEFFMTEVGRVLSRFNEERRVAKLSRKRGATRGASARRRQ